MRLLEHARNYLNSGLSVIPTRADKLPAVDTWKPYQTVALTTEDAERVFTGSKVQGIAVICGAVSGNLEVIDVDCKYDLTRTLWTEFKALIEEHLPEIANELLIAETVNKGYHVYFKSPAPQGNQKLAQRHTTPEERHKTYQVELAKGEAEEAWKRSENDKVKVLLETRGEGGYVIAEPTPGYRFIQGSYDRIPLITDAQRETLFNLAKSFHEIHEEPKAQTDQTAKHRTASPIGAGLSPFEDYNERADVVGLLQSYGWKVTGQSGERVYLKRPGSSDSKTSGNYHSGLRVFYPFSTSTEFSSEKGYNAVGVYAVLECNGDYSEASKRLHAEGYGDRYRSGAGEAPRTQPTATVTDSLRVEGITPSGDRIELGSPLTATSLKAQDLSKVYIYHAPGSKREEILKALDVLDYATEARAYVAEVSDLNTLTDRQESLPAYAYRLHALITSYGEIEDSKGSLDAEDVDALLQGAVELASSLRSPTDRDRFTKLFTTLEAVKELGITGESLTATADKLSYKAEEAKRDRDLTRLLETVADRKAQGDLKGAVTAIEGSLQAIRRESGKDLLPPALTSVDILSQIAETAPAFKTGYKDLDKFVGFTPGAITLVAGRPSHGKTTLLFNLLLEMSGAYGKEGYKFYFFTFEEPLKNLAIKLLNRLIATDLSAEFKSFTELARPTNYEFLKAYIKANRTDLPAVEEGKRLFSDLIDSGRIEVVDRNYSVEEIASLIAYQSQREKIGAVFIDYIQRMRTERRTQDKRTEIAHISDQVLQIAKENNLPLIVGAQLNRSAQTKPTLENLKEAGNLEEDANTVLSVYNESREKEEDAEGNTYHSQKVIELEIKALKNREGEVNRSAKLAFDKYTGLISDQTATSSGSTW